MVIQTLLSQPKASSEVRLQNYDRIVVAFSGGKDSTACVLHLLEQGIDVSNLEIWHHDVDGRGASTLMDWPCTTSYCRKFADALGIPIYFTWKVGGIEGELLRDNEKTKPVSFETPGGVVMTVGGQRGKPNTRRRFPQQTANLLQRWCSAVAKIDNADFALRHQMRFYDGKTLFVTGERAQESPGRAKYAIFEPHRADNRGGRKIKRYIDHFRPVHKWTTEQVWEIIRRWRIRPHPAYFLGWGRVSCAACIFGSKDQWASLHHINREQVERIMAYEDEFGWTINRKKSVRELISEGKRYPTMHPDDIIDALHYEYSKPMFMENWKLPAGAFGESSCLL